MKTPISTIPFLITSAIMSLLAAIWLGGCASGTRPHEMGATQHQTMAAKEDRAAAQHTGQYDSTAAEANFRCRSIGRGYCWYETINPTAEHKAVADRNRELALRHRAASQTLLDAESRACKDVPDEDRDMSPFAHNKDIRSVKILRDETFKSKELRDAGATIEFRAVPGLTEEWLQRIVNCHLARNAAVGHGMPEMSYCPLVPRGTRANVRSLGDGFAVDIRADSPVAVAEIWRRAQLIHPVP